MLNSLKISSRRSRFLFGKILVMWALFPQLGGAQALNGYFRGSDGGHYYVRTIGTDVYWFGEHPSGSFANVFQGKRTGVGVTGTFYDVPKGGAQGTGALSVQINPDGNGFTKTSGNFGATTWEKMTLPTSGLPGDRAEGFSSSTGPDNLTGRWFCDDGGIYYIRHIGNTLVWYGETSNTNGKPAFANIGIGFGARGTFLLSWIDLPKGNANAPLGILGLRQEGGYSLVKTRTQRGNFGGSRWSRTAVPPGASQEPVIVGTMGRTAINTKRDETQPRESVRNDRYCTTKQVDASKGMAELVVLSGGMKDKIYPGAIYKDQDILRGSFNPNPTGLTQPNYQIVTDNFCGNTRFSTGIQVAPGLSSVQDGMAELMRRANNCFTPANLNVEVIEINSAQQAEFEVGASYSGFGASVSASLSSANSKSQSLFLAKLNQVYFSISVPDKPIGFDTIPADLVYVSKVNYGRVGYLLIESSASSETIRASLEGGYAGATVSVSARLTNSDSRTKITSFFLGGDALNIPSITTASGLDQWMNYMRAGLRINPDVAPFPVSYELKYLNDNMTARVSSTSRFTQSECVTAPGLDIIFHNVTVSRQDINEGLSSDGGRLWGDVKFRVVGPTSPTNRAERVYLNEIPYSITEDRRGSRDGIWGRASAFPCEFDREPDNKLNGATYSVKVHPDILDRVFLEVTMQIGTKHKDNDFTLLGWHGMSQPETYRRSLRFLLDQNANRNISCPNGPSEERQWGSETPRYCSNTDRVHCFTTLFTVKPTTVN